MFPQHTIDSAPEASRPWLEEVEADFGMIPNLERTLAASPPALEAYARLWALADTCRFDPIELQIIYQTANFENNCTYCVPWHTFLSAEAKMSEEDIEALRASQPLSDPKREELRLFSRSLIHHRGHPPQEAKDAFFAAGYTAEHALEVVLVLAVKLISNYTNGIADTPLDDQVAHLKWEKQS